VNRFKKTSKIKRKKGDVRRSLGKETEGRERRENGGRVA
jgi:hypothetical protein